MGIQAYSLTNKQLLVGYVRTINQENSVPPKLNPETLYVVIWVLSGTWVGYKTYRSMRQDGIRKPYSAVCAGFVGCFGIIAALLAFILINYPEQ